MAPPTEGLIELVWGVTRALGATSEQPRFRTTGVLPARDNSQQSHPTAWLRWNNLQQNAVKNFNELDNCRTEIRLQVS